VVICVERGADLHMAQLMPLPLTVSCFTKIQIGFTFLVPAHLSSLGKRAVKRVCCFLRYLFACELSFTFCDFDTVAFLIISTVIIHCMLTKTLIS